MFHFISGYTSKVAGTEMGITEPQMVFSACFGAPFMPLHPTKYATLLGEKMKKYNVNVWLINTGWYGGPYGVGGRRRGEVGERAHVENADRVRIASRGRVAEHFARENGRVA